MHLMRGMSERISSADPFRLAFYTTDCSTGVMTVSLAAFSNESFSNDVLWPPSVVTFRSP